MLDQVAHAIAVRRGDHQRLAEAEFVELGGGLRSHALGLVDGEHDAAPGHAQALADAPVLRREAFAGIEHEDDDVALGDRLLGLRRHLADDAFGVHRLEAAGVDDDVVARPAAGLRRSGGRGSAPESRRRARSATGSAD